MRYSMMIEPEKCVGCLACVSACKQQWGSGPGAARDWVHTFEHGTRGKDLGLTFYPGLCMQCEQHPCTADCPTGATYMDERGVVVVDPDVCIGCGNCISTCAYDARHHDAVKKIVEKCNLCEPYVLRGELPACVQTCPADCRHFGDLDDAGGELVRLNRLTGAKPLTTPEVSIGPKVTFAGDAARAHILAAGVVKPPVKSWLTRTWSGVTMPVGRVIGPAFAVAAVAGGLLVNVIARRQKVREAAAAEHRAPDATLPRHRLGVRLLHWFNVLTWVLLLSTGIALMTSRSFSFYGVGYPAWLGHVVGGAARMLRFHVLWGLLWTLVAVPLFFLYKGGIREVLGEVWLRRHDLDWILAKPLHMLGLRRQKLPPQDKYNAGQKLFAISVLGGSATIMATGVIMTFHLGPSALVVASILVHKLAILLVFLGVALHVTMAAVIRDERPALKSMITGVVDRHHAEEHSPLWVAEIDEKNRHEGVPPSETEGKKR